ncbi:hypothetical protein [Derxia gummosa]|uniref:Uncharacterized protein n=1 Tax=Derxia gummosa DSM 723 TaxID=1121388 RepID=A0A8B6XCK1_9BURK|nr:hypothetical protein [Derxia gummosa]
MNTPTVRKPAVNPDESIQDDISKNRPEQDHSEDLVDESIEESFPASDPPSQHDPDHE